MSRLTSALEILVFSAMLILRVTLVAAAVLANGAAGAQGSAAPLVSCALQLGPAQIEATVVQFELVIDCGSGVRQGQRVPRNAVLLVGLTLYGEPKQPTKSQQGRLGFERRELQAAPQVAAALGNGVASRGALIAGYPRWIVLEDEDAASYDLPVQQLKISHAGEQQRLVYAVPAAAAAGHPHLLFALWPLSAREPCNKAQSSVRSGCQRDGYILEGEPVAVYPGREINVYTHPSGDWTSERWIVERWR